VTGATYFTVSATGATQFTLALSDAFTYVRCTGLSATVTVPLQSSVTWLDGTEIMLEQGGTGQLTVVGATGVTINSSATLKSRAQYAVVGLKRISSDLWTFVGDRATS
jgi:hypothetical protein